MEVSGRRALITGASQGIAAAAAAELARAGVETILVARRRAQLEETVATCRAAGAKSSAVVGDVGSAAGCAQVIAEIGALAGAVDIVVNVVGAMAVPTAKHVTDFEDDAWTANVELNLMSAVRMNRAFVPGMVERGWGRVINFSSLVGVEPEPFVAPYSAAKAAVIAYTKALARDVAPSGVTVNAVIPGLINTPKIAARSQEVGERIGKSVDEVLALELKRRPIPVGRPGTAAELAPLIGLLCSDAASFITGTAIPVDGGALRRA